MFQVLGVSFAGPLTPFELDGGKIVEAFPAGETNWCIGINGPNNSKMSHFGVIFVLSTWYFSQVEIWLHLPQFVGGCNFKKNFGKPQPGWEEKRNQRWIGTTFPMGWWNISPQFHIICRQAIKHHQTNSKKKPLNKKPNPQLIMAIPFIFLFPLRPPKKELPTHPTGFAKIQEVKKLPKAQSHPYLPRYNGGRKPRVWKSSHVWSYKLEGTIFYNSTSWRGEITPEFTQFIRSFNL